ncbi:MAG: AbrB/MazE/SpoVT family DNA-binding domain-containing protein [bacterium]|nr:AbrB/MazE/SpoVT family DNA-binding domain-containing protein [bacterium]
MIQKVLKVGSSVAVTIPKNALLGLGIKAGDNVNLTVNEKTREVSFRPVVKRPKIKNSDNHQEKIAALTLNFINRYRSDLESLAGK